ncbi:hypothetical protein RI845_16070 [Thalassotalea nanhaiensis]|uniref:Uncharacterized protein n=1 Tax=Thalassotalea nanhaiensis TaxID=3065648 RepID=A0ABY9TGX2_9GAMM|nr:hypothetical protein RI845_16070 [Colwelliaceae bacterium SQ345]
MKSLKAMATLVLLTSTIVVSNSAVARDKGRNSEGAPVVFVTSQGLYYDSIALGDLPPRGNFQQLVPTMNGLTTEFGPGDEGHLGGRWWIDLTDDGVMNEGDKFFLCPLLGPGRTTL